MKKRIGTLVAATALISTAASLIGCSASRGYSGKVDLNTDTNGVTIDFWTGFGTDITAYLDPIFESFQKETGITVTHTSKGGYDNLQKAINLGASTVSYPNIAVGYPDHFASYIDSDIQLRLDDYISADSTFNIDDYYSYYMTENQNLEYKEDGSSYTLGVPFNKSTEVMVYNSTFFNADVVKAAGIALPETWDDVETVGQKIITFLTPHFGYIVGTDGKNYDTADKMTAALGKDAKPIIDLTNVTAENFYPMGYDSTANLFITGVKQWGGAYTEIDKTTRKGYVAFNNAECLSFLTYMKKLAKEKVLALPKSFDGTGSYCSNYYVNFQCLMNIGSSAGLTHYSSGSFTSSNGQYSGTTHIPYKDATHKLVISQGTNLGLFDKGTEAERVASWKLLKYLSTTADGLFCAQTGYYPSCKSATESTDYQSFLNGTGKNDNEVNKLAAAKTNSTVYDADNSGWTKFVDPGFNGSSTIRTSVGNLISEVMIDQTDPQTAINSHYAELSDYVRSN